MRLVAITLFIVFLSGITLAQDTLKNYFADKPAQIQSWYIIDIFKGQPIYNGGFMIYHINGETKQHGKYSMGEFHGVNQTFNQNGILVLKCRYTNGILNGEYKVYYQSGNLKERKVYINGKLQGDYKYFEDKENADPYLIDKYKMGQKQ